MLRPIRALVLAVVLVGALAAPARAEWGYWSASGCRPDVQWYGTSQGIYYASRFGTFIVHSDFPNRFPFLETFLSRYAYYGKECGFLGPPANGLAYMGSGWYAQGFEGGQLWYSELGNWITCNWQKCWWG